jgi:molecular chaperone Hsp33
MDILLKAMANDEPILLVALVDTDTVERARLIHDTYPTASAALGRVMSGALLLSSLLKEGQKVIIQVAGDGPLKGVIAEADWLCRVRGYVKRPHVHLGIKDGKLDVGRAIGSGFLNVIKDLGLRDYYQGSVPLQTGEIATDLAYYLHNSEQIPAAVSLGVYVDTDNAVTASGGFMIHSLPGASDEIAVYLEDRLKGVQPVSSMIRAGLAPEKIIEEATGLSFKILERRDVVFSCHCTRERVLDAIITLGKKDIEELIHKGETAKIECQFCKTEYLVARDELQVLLEEAESGGDGQSQMLESN